MESLHHDRLFVALTRPQMFGGVTYSWFVINMVLTAELFLIFRSIWVLLAAVLVHAAGLLLSLRDARFVDLWVTRASRCGRVRNHGLWRCNSYRP